MNDNNAILVVAVPQRGALTPATYELLTAGRVLADAAKQPLLAVLPGGTAEHARDLIERGADKAVYIDSPALAQFNDELCARAVADVARQEKAGRLLLASSVAGRSLAARLSVLLKAGLSSEVFELDPSGTKAKRYHYSGNLIGELELKAPIQVMTLQPMGWPRAERQPGRAGQAVAGAFDPAAAPARAEFVSFQAEESNEIDLGAAERIVSGGRGLGTAEGFKTVYQLAHAIGAAVGASRAVVDSGWIAYRHQVGLTGRAVRPKLYIACGISGQIQHLAGMSSSGTIVAINTDADCPMMQVASISVQADVFEILPAITEEIKKRKGTPVAA